MADTFSGVVTSDGKKRAFLTDDALTKSRRSCRLQSRR